MSEGAGWLQISTAGFAALNQSRPPEHLVKELVQNSLDAVQDAGGSVELDYHHDGQGFHVECRDSGSGIDDLAAMRVVYLTFKTDSHLKRGRFGRGFKEILSVANTATIVSGGREIYFFQDNGQQATRETEVGSAMAGTCITMSFDWPPETADQFDLYFERLLVPSNVRLSLNGRPLAGRSAVHTIEAELSTEVYNPESHSWRKPRRKSAIELFETRDGEEPFIYEMGIPVALAEWSMSYHANVLQRVPMNPNRDALASGYAKRIHRACLPTLLAEMSDEDATADWVGSAGAQLAPELQKQIMTKAFGSDAVRSVPTVGKRDFDHDAERIGASIVKTSQLSSGFREMARVALPTAKETVVRAEAKAAKDAAQTGFNLSDITRSDDPRSDWIKQQGGKPHVDRCLAFAVWFCQQLVHSTGVPQRAVTGNLALGRNPVLFGTEFGTFLAHWSNDNVLTLAIDTDCFWQDPLGAQALSVLVHEAAHAQNMHHGKGFVDEIERLAGVAAHVMFECRDEIVGNWPELTADLGGPDSIAISAHKIAEAKPKRSWFLDLRRRT